MASGAGTAAAPSLPDLLSPELDIVFVGINPSLYSVAKGHYFARPTNRFWAALSRSRLSAKARKALGLERLEPCHDALLLEHGIGFTDVVKRPSARAAELSRSELEVGAEALAVKLATFKPRIACVHGLMAYRPLHRLLAPDAADPSLGMQKATISTVPVFVVPNPSPANAHFTPADQTQWYDRLAAALEELPG